ncbi:MAG: glycerophosphodiester phosphodiesterase family protein [Brevibacterium aurantiacum]|uniref:Glycerophosphodiester phosphodiesterase n=1 Tax=Brevibacterium aurantiacum TaxID=273384 RepID=A0A2A3X8L1_BREAU|nr:glycerophosphodiester phosphodiesterase family protein [Brevibacterium aurantiacum]MDN5552295.1 glycerophosphodiester phosphodiesterase [Brevibacterium sp.]AZT97366.1 glycerophosphodiester phosphodiesterase [Brevibacterium aurantiacum]MDN5606575.1 glycerophosphodiester phosphodiesterase [Brevibacterium sp.]MDN5659247.1 glycerophosphodiester phosphodiesterase [Brevibacterium aurantiacum]MDN5712066.1 glycerophosphodiester phosphodiesterase [Brevibacterium aurantiacum]
MNSQAEIIAHRGGQWPGMSENTLEAFASAHQAGVRWMETDVHASADGVVFAAHDADLDRIAGRPHRIRDLKAAELDSIELIAGGHLPRLTTLLEELPDLAWNIDVKAAHSIAPMIRTIRSREAGERIRLASFSSSTLRRLREALPGVRSSAGVFESALFALGALPGVADSGLTPLPAGLDALQVPMSFKGLRVLTEDFVSRAHRSGLQIHVWTINDVAEMRTLLDLGVDGIVTDDVLLGLREIAAWT